MAEKVEYKQERWILEDLFPAIESEQVQSAIKDLESAIANFEQFRPRLKTELDGEEFYEVLEAYEDIDRRLSRLGGFAGLLFSGDTQDQAAQSFQARIQQKAAEADNRSMFFKLWWKSLDDGMAEQLIRFAGDYRYWLEKLRLQKPFTLSEPEEKIVNLKDVNGVSALVSLYTTITNRYTFKLEVDGEQVSLNREQLGAYYYSPDPALRIRTNVRRLGF